MPSMILPGPKTYLKHLIEPLRMKQGVRIARADDVELIHREQLFHRFIKSRPPGIMALSRKGTNNFIPGVTRLLYQLFHTI